MVWVEPEADALLVPDVSSEELELSDVSVVLEASVVVAVAPVAVDLPELVVAVAALSDE